MKEKVVREKKFLRRVYKTKDFKLIDKASFDQLKAILIATHLVINKKVPITKKIAKDFLSLGVKVLEDLKKVFKEPQDLLKLFQLDRAQVVKILKKYFGALKITLKPYFTKARKENLLT